jgi:hypothetical protein
MYRLQPLAGRTERGPGLRYCSYHSQEPETKARMTHNSIFQVLPPAALVEAARYLGFDPLVSTIPRLVHFPFSCESGALAGFAPIQAGSRILERWQLDIRNYQNLRPDRTRPGAKDRCCLYSRIGCPRGRDRHRDEALERCVSKDEPWEIGSSTEIVMKEFESIGF